MATYSKQFLSASTDGKSVNISSTGTAGTLIHVPPTGTSSIDEVWLYGVNAQSSSVKLTIEWGETTAPNGNIETTIPGESGLYLISPGLLIANSSPIRAFAATANVVLIHGFVNRITA